MRKNVTKKLMSMLLSIALVIGLLSGITMVSEPITADAAPALLGASEPVTYIYRDENNISGEARTISEYTLVSGGIPPLTYTEGWYVFQGNIYPQGRCEVNGTVNIILMDDCQFFADYGIHINPGAHLNIYGQEKDEGKIEATCKSNSPIGGNEGQNDSNRSLTVNGGIISARAKDGAAAVGAGKKGSFGNITINGGSVYASGADDAAGIGGSESGGRISTIKINNGLVSSWGYEGGAGIGGGADSADGGEIIITGGDVYAVGGGGDKWRTKGAGIGGGENRTGPDQITITGGKVKADGSYDGAAIGGGYEGHSGNITISGGEIIASRGREGAGIGGGFERGIAKGKKVLITGGYVEVHCPDISDGAHFQGAGIGAGAMADQGGDIFIEDGVVSVKSEYGAGIGGGGEQGGPYSHRGGNVTISDGIVIASSQYGAGIGGGGAGSFDQYKSKGTGGNVTVSGGEVYASATHGGAAIGGGNGCDGGSFTITDGYVVAHTGAVIYDWVDYVNPKMGINPGKGIASWLGNLLGKLIFSHPEEKSPAAIGGGYAPASNASGGGGAGSFTMTGGVLLAKTDDTDVPAIGASSDHEQNGSYSLAPDLYLKYSDNLNTHTEDLEQANGENRDKFVKEKAYIQIGVCEHDDNNYIYYEDKHRCTCEVCKEWYLSYQPHQWDETGMTCWVCGYKRNDGLCASFVNQDAAYVYKDGVAIKPELKVTYKGRTLTENTDYDIYYYNNEWVGRASVQVVPHVGLESIEPLTLYYDIQKANLEQLYLNPTSYEYDGAVHEKPEYNVKSGGDSVRIDFYEVEGSSQTDAGSYSVTVKAVADKCYEGTLTASWSIEPRKLNRDDGKITFDLSPSSYTYDGTAKTPQVTITDNGLASGSPKVLEQGKDYTVTYKNNINAGEGTVIITGQGNYTGTVEKTFTIEKAPITQVALNKTSLPYTGSLNKVSVLRVVAEVDGKTLEVPLNECKISGDTGINAGTYSLKVDTVESSNFAKADAKQWQITPKELSNFARLYANEYVYTEEAIKPEVDVTDGSIPLKEGTDYELTYDNNIEKGHGSVTVNLTGNYSGSQTLTFDIIDAGTSKDIAQCNIELSPDEYTYDRAAKTPDVTVKDEDTTLTKGTDYTVDYYHNTEVGTAIAVVKGIGNYRGAVAKQYTIKPVQIDGTDIVATLSETEYVYDGNKKMPYVTVKDLDTILKGIREDSIDSSVNGEASLNGYDYTYKYVNNKNAGTATVIITGVGRYTGTKEITFNIKKAKIDMAELSESYFFSSHGDHNMTLFVSADGVMLPRGSYDVSGDVDDVTETGEDDYTTILEPKKDEVGDYSVTVTAKSDSNYQGSVTIPFYIVEDGTSLFDAQLLETRYIYDGNAKKPDVTVTGARGILTEGKDYTLEYRDNVNAGTAAVVVSGKGNYHGSRTLFYTIEKAQLDVVNISDSVLRYTGEEQTVGVLSVFADKTETYGNYVPEVNYTVSGNSAKDIGTYQLTVTAKDNSNYRGSVSVPYSIVSDNDKVFTAQLESDETTYDGTAKEPVVTVTGDTELTKDTDYTVTYQDNVDAGVARVFISGKGEYEGTRVLLFRINKAPLQAVSLDGEAALTYNGDYQTMNVKEVKAGSIQSPITVPSEAYSITGDTVRSPGEYTLKATAKTHSNFTGEATTSFAIKPNNSALWMDIQDTEFIYNGKEQKPIVYIYDGYERLTQGEDYNIEYSDNVNAGAGMIKVTYLGKYAGGDVDVYSCSFAIEKAAPTITTLPTASKVTSGQTLADSTLRGGKATVDGKTIQGQFEWEDSTIAPDVSDSDAEYTVKFIPTDNANYSVVTCEVKLGAKSVTPTPTPTPVPDEDYPVPIENKSAIDINAHISGGIATISDISSEAIESVIKGDGREPSGDSTGKITIDISCAAQTVTGIEIGKQTLDNLSNAVNNNAEIDAVEIKLTDTYVMLDGTAAEAIASQAQGDTIRLKINTKTESSLNNAQRNALSAFSYRSPFEAYFESGGEKIRDFGGGQATVSVKQGIPEGMDARYFHIYYVPEDGKLTVHKTWYENGMLSFKTGHFSDYSIVYDDTMRNDTLPEGFTRNTDGTLTFTDSELGTVIIADEVVREGATYRMYNPNTGEHTFTKNAAEVYANVLSGWNHEEDADFQTFGYDTKDSLIVYRLYSKYTGLHHYTMDRDEAIWNVQALGYNFEGIVFYALPSDSEGGTELYRLYNPYDYQHLWTTNKDEYDYLGSVGWNKEGVAFKVQ